MEGNIRGNQQTYQMWKQMLETRTKMFNMLPKIMMMSQRMKLMIFQKKEANMASTSKNRNSVADKNLEQVEKYNMFRIWKEMEMIQRNKAKLVRMRLSVLKILNLQMQHNFMRIKMELKLIIRCSKIHRQQESKRIEGL